MSGGGFGSMPWGGGPWGGGALGGTFVPSTFVSVLAIAENVIRVYFTAPPYFSGLLDLTDASLPSHYSIQPVAGTTGRDGNPPRPVTALFAAIGLEPASIDVTLDRPMTPSPAQYSVTVTGLVDAATAVAVPAATGTTPALYRVLVPATLDRTTPSRDIANPNSLADLAAVSPYASPASPLGTIPYDDTGDYAPDEGLVSYKKRCIRRGITKPNGFAFLPGYGVGIPQHGKKLQRASLRASLAAEWQRQILLEPETAQASVDSSVDPLNPAFVYFSVRARTKAGKSANFRLPVSIG